MVTGRSTRAPMQRPPLSARTLTTRDKIGLTMQQTTIAPTENTRLWHDITDEELARRSSTRLLITNSSRGGAEALAYRIHHGSLRGSFPFVRVQACDLPSEPGMLRDTCSVFLGQAAGGTALISDVDEMAPAVQEVFLGVVQELELARPPNAAVRLVAATTVSLTDRIAAGKFSEQLFYRLNTIHLVA